MKIKNITSKILAVILSSITTLGSAVPVHAGGKSKGYKPEATYPTHFSMAATSFTPRQKKPTPTPATKPPFPSLAEKLEKRETITRETIKEKLGILNDMLKDDGVTIEISAEASFLHPNFLYTVLYEFYNLFSKYPNVKKICVDFLTQPGSNHKLIIDTSTDLTKGVTEHLNKNTFGFGRTLSIDNHTSFHYMLCFSAAYFYQPLARDYTDMLTKIRERLYSYNPSFFTNEYTDAPIFTYCAQLAIGYIIHCAYDNHIHRTQLHENYIEFQNLSTSTLSSPDFETKLSSTEPDHARGFTQEVFHPIVEELSPRYALLLHDASPIVTERSNSKLIEELLQGEPKPVYFPISYANRKVNSSTMADITRQIDYLIARE